MTIKATLKRLYKLLMMWDFNLMSPAKIYTNLSKGKCFYF